MFQSFEVTSSPKTASGRIKALRREMRALGLDHYLVPHSDVHQSEYLPPGEERLAWLTGFTGSAGFAIVTAESAILFVDGRYTLQAASQTDPTLIAIESLTETPPSKWIGKNAGSGARIGYDPWLLTIGQKRTFEKAAGIAGGELVESADLIGRIWDDRPPAPAGSVTAHDISLAGRNVIEKIAVLRADIGTAGADLLLMTDLASLAWTFNIRGSDIQHAPLAIGFAILPLDDRPLLFIEPSRLDETANAQLAPICDLLSPAKLEAKIGELAKGRKVLCDESQVAAQFATLIENAGGTVIAGRDPVALPRAMKNDAELSGSRSAHLRDGVAVTRFLAWLDRQHAGSTDEIAAASALENFRTDTAKHMNSALEEISFDTISGAGPNGAIVHYRVNTDTNAPLLPDSLYLVDSGAQYRDGTTDITRTVAIGRPPPGAREDFTLVLKGHIAIATARFPAGTRGVDLDPLARIALWKNGRDYAHGTGHGVGSFLSVHEGPQGISRRAMEPLKPGMIISNEPGMYREGCYGIRIENLVVVQAPTELPEGTVPMHSFETLTLAPIDLRLVDRDLLVSEEIAWLNAYHATVRESLSPWLDETDRQWLNEATKAI